jgi:hypothetical protein
MISKMFSLESVVLTVFYSIVVLTIVPSPVAAILIKPVLNDSLCVRTEAYEWEGAMMRTSDCER